MQSISTNLQAAAQKQVQSIADSYSAQIQTVQTNSAGALNTTISITNAISKINSALNNCDSINNSLLNMSSSITSATTDPQYATESWDYGLSAVSSMAQSDTSSNNLLGTMQRGGNYTPNSIQYVADQTGRVVTVTGAYLGADYMITQPDGTYWMPSGSQALQQYTAYPFGAKGSAVSTGMTNIETNASAPPGEVSYTANLSVAASGQQVIQGTLSQPGLSVLNAFQYNNFATPADCAKAQSDLTNAQAQVTLTENSLNAALVQAQSDLAKESNAQSSTTAQVTALQNQAQSAEQFVNDQAQMQMRTIQNEFNAPDTSALSIMQGGDSGSLFSALLPSSSSTSSSPASSILGGGSVDALLNALIPPASSSQSSASSQASQQSSSGSSTSSPSSSSSSTAPGSVLNVNA